MQTFLLTAGALITLAGIVPYIVDITKRKTKPRIVSWFNWSLLTGVATAAAIAEGEYASAVLTAAATLATITVVVLGIRYGERKFETFDVICQLGAIVGIIMWAMFDSPLAAILITVGIDFIVGLPTWKHAWQKPHEETVIAFVAGGIGGMLTLLAIEEYTVAGLAYPVLIFSTNWILVSFILFSPHRHDRRASQS